jgi:hypothetical protein
MDRPTVDDDGLTGSGLWVARGESPDKILPTAFRLVPALDFRNGGSNRRKQDDQRRPEVQDFKVSADQCILPVCPAVHHSPAPGEVSHRNLPGQQDRYDLAAGDTRYWTGTPRDLSVALPISLVQV